MQTGFLPRNDDTFAARVQFAHGLKGVVEAILPQQHEHRANGIRHLLGSAIVAAPAASGIGVIVDGWVAVV
jgi:hypothetical protein